MLPSRLVNGISLLALQLELTDVFSSAHFQLEPTSVGDIGPLLNLTFSVRVFLGQRLHRHRLRDVLVFANTRTAKVRPGGGAGLAIYKK